VGGEGKLAQGRAHSPKTGSCALWALYGEMEEKSYFYMRLSNKKTFKLRQRCTVVTKKDEYDVLGGWSVGTI